MFNESSTIIVVYDDDLLVNQFEKMVNERNKLLDPSQRLSVVRWKQKVWKQNSEAGDIASPVVFLGTLHRHDGLVQVMDVKYHQKGIRYGWAGNQAAVVANPDKLFSRRDYVKFLCKFVKLPVSIPSVLQQDGLHHAIALEKGGKLEEVINNALKSTFLDALCVNTNGKLQYIGDLKRRQQLFYGTVHFVNHALEAFLTASSPENILVAYPVRNELDNPVKGYLPGVD